MFFSQILLSKSGPLASVWLASNQDRKVSKNQIIHHDLQKSVNAIVQPQEAPFSLRLSGQLLFGVVRIYGRKARYLLEDCNEAMLKIKLAFRPNTGHLDLPANLPPQARNSLMIPDRLTAYDDLGSLPPPSSQLEDMSATPLSSQKSRHNRDINLQQDFNNSQFLDEIGLGGDEIPDQEDIGINLDFGLDFGMEMDMDMNKTMDPTDPSVELGRDAVARSVEADDMLSELGLAGPIKDRHARDDSVGMDLDFGDGVQIADNDGDIRMEDDVFHLGEPSIAPAVAPMAAAPDPARERMSESPLSDVDEEYARQIEQEYSGFRNLDMYEPADDTSATVTAPQRSKKRKLLQPDEHTMLSTTAIKEANANRDNILKPNSFIPRNAQLLALMEMQKNGGFVKHVLFEGRAEAWAPELKGLLSFDAIRPTDRKRKRDSGIADMGSDQEEAQSKSPRLELPEDETVVPLNEEQAVGEHSEAVDGTMLELQADDGILSHDGAQELNSPGPAFDETAAPLVHPADSGMVSIGTKHAVHILRDLFGAEAATDADKRKKAAVVFQELLPEARTTKADATKMFFECLVLATKDAIKVEQPEDMLGGPIRVRGKRGLWGAWAEREAGGEMDQEENRQEQQEERDNAPEPAIASAPAVSVSA